MSKADRKQTGVDKMNRNKAGQIRILAFGDSNTWGYIPGGSGRYPAGTRWTTILEELDPEINVWEEGLCGRTTIFQETGYPDRTGVAGLRAFFKGSPVPDAAILMLGTNDCKPCFGVSAKEIGEGIQTCLDELERVLPPRRILLMSPILLGEDVWKPEKDPAYDRRSVAVAGDLKTVYTEIATARGCAFLAASDYADPDPQDEEHMNETGHRQLAEAVYGKLREMGVVSQGTERHGEAPAGAKEA